jgi:hypothetical protein
LIIVRDISDGRSEDGEGIAVVEDVSYGSQAESDEAARSVDLGQRK